jgi:hypothetical protein
VTDLDTQVKVAIYRHFAATASRPSVADLAAALDVGVGEIEAALPRLRASRVLFFEPDGVTIRMAPPFSGVPTQHEVEAGGRRYFANCAWDALGIPAALRDPGIVRSRCEQTHEPLRLEVGTDGPPRSDWIFHCQVPAAHWWDDLVFT